MGTDFVCVAERGYLTMLNLLRREFKGEFIFLAEYIFSLLDDG